MTKTFTYKKAAVLCTVSFPLVVLAFQVVMAAGFIIDFHSRGKPVGGGNNYIWRAVSYLLRRRIKDS